MPEDSKTEASKESESKSSGWWQTLPGMLTAIAATITAIGGLIAALHQAGMLPTSSKPSPSPEASTPSVLIPPPSPTVVASPTTPETSPPTNQQPIILTAGMEVKLPAMGGGNISYKILSAQLEPFNTEDRSLNLKIRCTSNNQDGANFWDRSFRLVVNGVPRSPSNELNEIVAPQTAKEGEIIFTVPASARKVILQIGDPGKEMTQISFDLTTAKS